MFALCENYADLSIIPVREDHVQNLCLESTLIELTLYEFQLESSVLAVEAAKAFEVNPMLPGVILTEQEEFLGAISRRRFLEYLSRPYGLELFLKRPISSLYRFARRETLILPAHTLIVLAARQSLNREPALLNEPVIVEVEEKIYKLLDVHQLLVAGAQIQHLTSQLLKKQTQAQMMQTEKMASLGKMVAGVAHEIRNPVNSLGGNIGFLSNYFEDIMQLLSVYETESVENSPRIVEVKEEIEFDFLKRDLKQVIQTMRIAADRLIKIVAGLRNFSHMDETNRRPADIHECIDSTLLILHNSLKDKIEVIKDYTELPPVSCYSGQLSQVFMNLISNSIDALMDAIEAQKNTTTGKNWQAKIEITTKVIESEEQKWASIKIADNGPGIPSEIQGKIFEMFFTTKGVGKGTGIGLAISYQIITEKHGGKLNLRSPCVDSTSTDLDKGTEFEILLPLDPG